jgi:DNA-binding LacI/PurR family transcriptional regulator
LIEQPVARTGEVATMRLLARVGGEPLSPERIIVPTPIIFRESTAPPPRHEAAPNRLEAAPTAQG